jgi:hypothetical protein
MFSDIFYSMLVGSLKSTGIVNFVRSFPMLSLITFQREIFFSGDFLNGRSYLSSNKSSSLSSAIYS